MYLLKYIWDSEVQNESELTATLSEWQYTEDSCFVTKNKIISFIKKSPSLSHFHDVTKYITESQIREMKKTRTSELVTSDPNASQSI